MDRTIMIKLIKENPGVKISHPLFSDDEYIFQRDGRVYDENVCLFEDWESEGIGQHNGIRMRCGGDWESDWYVKNGPCLCKRLSKTTSGKEYLYSNMCKNCQDNGRCSYM